MKHNVFNIKKNNYITEFITNHNEYIINNNLLKKISYKLNEDYISSLLIFDNTKLFLESVMEYYNKKMLLEIKSKDFSSVRNKISKALFYQLNLINKNLITKIVKFYLLPENSFSAIKLLYKTCDIIWIYAGDKSTDYNFYTKRALLFLVIIPSIKIYKKDKSTNNIDTQIFIDSALEKIIKIGSIKKKFSTIKIEDIPFVRMFI